MRVRVEGGTPLNGDYQPSGSTNAAITLLAASLLTEEAVTLRHVPATVTVQAMVNIARRLGAEITNGKDSLTIRTKQVTRRAITDADTAESNAALLFLAPILVRRQFVRLEVDFPLNRIHAHLEAMRDLGFDVVNTDGAVECRAAIWEYKDIILAQTSVTATAIVMMLAATCGQETVLHNAASEPQLQELANLLEMMGAQIQGAGSNVLRIFGKADLNGAEVSVGPDHIETASIAALSAISGGRVHITGIRQPDLRTIEKVYRRLGITMDMDASDIFIPKHEQLTVSNREEDVDASIETAPWPGFPSDLVAIATVIATQARGTSLIHEKLFNNRLIFVDKLKSMGAQIVLCDPHRAIVVGPTPLYAIYMDSPDIRTGLGMLGAALLAQGETIIDNAHVLRYYFDDVIGKLQQLGAKITVEQ